MVLSFGRARRDAVAPVDVDPEGLSSILVGAAAYAVHPLGQPPAGPAPDG
jgi:hypothetical protein